METWDLYDKNHKKLNQVHLKGLRLPEDSFRLTVHVCLLNHDGNMLIQKRRQDKKIFPGLWDVSAAGSAVSGETSEMAAHRETLEEIGLDIDFSDIRPLLTVHFEEGFSDWYVVDCDVQLDECRIQESEVSDIRWASLSEIQELKRNRLFIPYYDGFVELLISMNKKRGAHQ